MSGQQQPHSPSPPSSPVTSPPDLITKYTFSIGNIKVSQKLPSINKITKVYLNINEILIDYNNLLASSGGSYLGEPNMTSTGFGK